REDCLSHETYPEPVELSLSAGCNTADELFVAARGHFANNGELVLSLDRDLVVSLDCACGFSQPVMKPQQLVGAADARCPECGKDARPRLEHSIRAGSALANEKSVSLGIPPFDTVRVADDKSEQVFLLGCDRTR